MSHQATSWAIRQRGLRPATKLVLWQLCDRYHPDHGCFPSQDTLADDCEMSRASVNRHLEELERLGLIRRIRRTQKKTNQRKSTLYILGFQLEFQVEKSGETEGEQTQKPCCKMRHGAMSQKTQKPCLKKRESHVSNCDSNLVKEPVIERVREPKPFFTDDERFEAKQITEHLSIGKPVRFEAIGRRVLECLIAEKKLKAADEARCRKLMGKEQGNG